MVKRLMTEEIAEYRCHRMLFLIRIKEALHGLQPNFLILAVNMKK